ncbi:MAG: hypothetical protein V3S69_06435 [Dehalococcoidales bacterium]
MNKHIQTIMTFFAGIFTTKPEAPTEPPAKRSGVITLYGSAMNRAQRRRYNHAAKAIKHTLQTFLTNGYDAALKRHSGRNVNLALDVLRLTDKGQELDAACKEVLIRHI